jgi:hypothetical protein
MKPLGYLGIDQYGTCYHTEKYPRKELLKQTGHKRASKMYCDSKSGGTRHVGYVIGPLWIQIFAIYPWKTAK